jgi:hypothetical protein
MSRYIDAEKVMEEINRIGGHNLCEWETIGVKALIDRQPTADVVEVRHGEWEIKSRVYRMLDDFDEEIYVECPFCKRTFYVPYEFDDEKTIAYARENYPYCHCGAKMDGERKD